MQIRGRCCYWFLKYHPYADAPCEAKVCKAMYLDSHHLTSDAGCRLARVYIFLPSTLEAHQRSFLVTKLQHAVARVQHRPYLPRGYAERTLLLIPVLWQVGLPLLIEHAKSLEGIMHLVAWLGTENAPFCGAHHYADKHLCHDCKRQCLLLANVAF